MERLEEQVVPRARKLPGQPDENSCGFQFTWEPAERQVDSRGNELPWVGRVRHEITAVPLQSSFGAVTIVSSLGRITDR